MMRVRDDLGAALRERRGGHGQYQDKYAAKQ
jgi:hypothetical protein